MGGTLLVRADAGSPMGTGHLMRTLALARAWQAAGGQATFASCCGVEALRERIRACGAGLVSLDHPHPDPADLATTLDLLAKAKSQSRVPEGDSPIFPAGKSGQSPAGKSGQSPSCFSAPEPVWVVLDGYHFDPAYQQAVRDAGGRLLVIDDLAHLEHYHADVLLNQNLGSQQLDTKCDPETTLLLGCRYALLRPEFQRWSSLRRETADSVGRLLVTLGGADPDNVTGTVVTALGRLGLPQLEVKVLVGSANPHLNDIREKIRKSSSKIELLRDVADVSELMAWADAAVSAAGSTCWELAFMQLPALLLVLAENQQPIAGQLAAAGAATNLGRADRLTVEEIARAIGTLCRNRRRRASQSRAGCRLVDGRGAERVVAVMRAVEGALPADEVRLRPATAEDVMPLWRLRNDPTARRASLASGEDVPLKIHVRWFTRRLASPGSRIWLLDFHGIVLGQIRYDRIDAETAEISISVAAAFRRRRLALKLLELTGQMARQQLAVRRLRAIVREENLPSARTFTRAGFAKVDFRPVQNHPCHIFELG